MIRSKVNKYFAGQWLSVREGHPSSAWMPSQKRQAGLRMGVEGAKPLLFRSCSVSSLELRPQRGTMTEWLCFLWGQDLL